jgi:predicted Zn-dependent protease
VKRLAPLAAGAALAFAACKTPPPPRPVVETPPAQVTPPPPAPVQPRPEVLVARARVLRAEGDVAGARARLEAAFETAPEDDEVRIELADLLVADGRDLGRAVALLEGRVERGEARLHLVRAKLSESLGDDATAASEYELALALEDDPDVRLRRALALERLGRAEATPELERVRADRPDDAVVRSRLAERYEAAGRLADAEAEYRWLAESQPERAAAWERLARFYERAGRKNDARAAAARARTAGGRQDRSLRPLLPSKR